MIGYGQSEMDAAQSSALDVQGELFVEMMHQWEVEDPVIIAHDFGGATTLRAHLLGGFDFSRYVLMNVVAVRPWGSEFFDHVGRNADAFTGLPPHIHEAIVRAYIGGALATPLRPEDLMALAEPWLSEAGRISFYRQFAQADEQLTADVEPLFSSIRCSTHIVWGEQDPWIPIARGRELQSMIGDASFDVLAGVGHLPQLESPDDALAALSRVLGFAA